MQVWVKNYYGNSVIDMQVLPSFENSFSENGHLGKYGTQTDNGNKVFTAYDDMSNNPLHLLYNGNSAISTAKLFNGQNGNVLNITSTSGQMYGSTNSYANFGSQFTVYALVYTYQYDVGFGAGTSGDYGYTADPGATANSQFALWQQNNGSQPQLNIVSYSQSPDTWYQIALSYNNGNLTGEVASPYADAFTSPLATVTATNTTYTSFNAFLINPYLTVSGSFMYYGLFFAINLPAQEMPTFTIGTPSVYQANATTTSEFSGSPGQDYNSTYQYFTYDIPLCPRSR